MRLWALVFQMLQIIIVVTGNKKLTFLYKCNISHENDSDAVRTHVGDFDMINLTLTQRAM